MSGLWAPEDAGVTAPTGPRTIWMMDEIEKGAGLDPNGGETPPPPPVDHQ
jgi:hypothetical protein